MPVSQEQNQKNLSRQLLQKAQIGATIGTNEIIKLNEIINEAKNGAFYKECETLLEEFLADKQLDIDDIIANREKIGAGLFKNAIRLTMQNCKIIDQQKEHIPDYISKIILQPAIGKFCGYDAKHTITKMAINNYTTLQERIQFCNAYGNYIDTLDVDDFTYIKIDKNATPEQQEQYKKDVAQMTDAIISAQTNKWTHKSKKQLAKWKQLLDKMSAPFTNIPQAQQVFDVLYQYIDNSNIDTTLEPEEQSKQCKENKVKFYTICKILFSTDKITIDTLNDAIDIINKDIKPMLNDKTDKFCEDFDLNDYQKVKNFFIQKNAENNTQPTLEQLLDFNTFYSMDELLEFSTEINPPSEEENENEKQVKICKNTKELLENVDKVERIDIIVDNVANEGIAYRDQQNAEGKTIRTIVISKNEKKALKETIRSDPKNCIKVYNGLSNDPEIFDFALLVVKQQHIPQGAQDEKQVIEKMFSSKLLEQGTSIKQIDGKFITNLKQATTMMTADFSDKTLSCENLYTLLKLATIGCQPIAEIGVNVSDLDKLDETLEKYNDFVHQDANNHLSRPSRIVISTDGKINEAKVKKIIAKYVTLFDEISIKNGDKKLFFSKENVNDIVPDPAEAYKIQKKLEQEEKAKGKSHNLDKDIKITKYPVTDKLANKKHDKLLQTLIGNGSDVGVQNDVNNEQQQQTNIDMQMLLALDKEPEPIDGFDDKDAVTRENCYQKLLELLKDENKRIPPEEKQFLMDVCGKGQPPVLNRELTEQVFDKISTYSAKQDILQKNLKKNANYLKFTNKKFTIEGFRAAIVNYYKQGKSNCIDGFGDPGFQSFKLKDGTYIMHYSHIKSDKFINHPVTRMYKPLLKLHEQDIDIFGKGVNEISVDEAIKKSVGAINKNFGSKTAKQVNEQLEYMKSILPPNAIDKFIRLPAIYSYTSLKYITDNAKEFKTFSELLNKQPGFKDLFNNMIATLGNREQIANLQTYGITDPVAFFKGANHIFQKLDELVKNGYLTDEDLRRLSKRKDLLNQNNSVSIFYSILLQMEIKADRTLLENRILNGKCNGNVDLDDPVKVKQALNFKNIPPTKEELDILHTEGKLLVNEMTGATGAEYKPKDEKFYPTITFYHYYKTFGTGVPFYRFYNLDKDGKIEVNLEIQHAAFDKKGQFKDTKGYQMVKNYADQKENKDRLVLLFSMLCNKWDRLSDGRIKDTEGLSEFQQSLVNNRHLIFQTYTDAYEQPTDNSNNRDVNINYAKINAYLSILAKDKSKNNITAEELQKYRDFIFKKDWEKKDGSLLDKNGILDRLTLLTKYANGIKNVETMDKLLQDDNFVNSPTRLAALNYISPDIFNDLFTNIDDDPDNKRLLFVLDQISFFTTHQPNPGTPAKILKVVETDTAKQIAKILNNADETNKRNLFKALIEVAKQLQGEPDIVLKGLVEKSDLPFQKELILNRYVTIDPIKLDIEEARQRPEMTIAKICSNFSEAKHKDARAMYIWGVYHTANGSKKCADQLIDAFGDLYLKANNAEKIDLPEYIEKISQIALAKDNGQREFCLVKPSDQSNKKDDWFTKNVNETKKLFKILTTADGNNLAKKQENIEIIKNTIKDLNQLCVKGQYNLEQIYSNADIMFQGLDKILDANNPALTPDQKKGIQQKKQFAFSLYTKCLLCGQRQEENGKQITPTEIASIISDKQIWRYLNRNFDTTKISTSHISFLAENLVVPISNLHLDCLIQGNKNKMIRLLLSQSKDLDENNKFKYFKNIATSLSHIQSAFDTLKNIEYTKEKPSFSEYAILEMYNKIIDDANELNNEKILESAENFNRLVQSLEKTFADYSNNGNTFGQQHLIGVFAEIEKIIEQKGSDILSVTSVLQAVQPLSDWLDPNVIKRLDYLLEKKGKPSDADLYNDIKTIEQHIGNQDFLGKGFDHEQMLEFAKHKEIITNKKEKAKKDLEDLTDKYLKTQEGLLLDTKNVEIYKQLASETKSINNEVVKLANDDIKNFDVLTKDFTKRNLLLSGILDVDAGNLLKEIFDNIKLDGLDGIDFKKLKKNIKNDILYIKKIGSQIFKGEIKDLEKEEKELREYLDNFDGRYPAADERMKQVYKDHELKLFAIYFSQFNADGRDLYVDQLASALIAKELGEQKYYKQIQEKKTGSGKSITTVGQMLVAVVEKRTPIWITADEQLVDQGIGDIQRVKQFAGHTYRIRNRKLVNCDTQKVVPPEQVLEVLKDPKTAIISTPNEYYFWTTDLAMQGTAGIEARNHLKESGEMFYDEVDSAFDPNTSNKMSIPIGGGIGQNRLDLANIIYSALTNPLAPLPGNDIDAGNAWIEANKNKVKAKINAMLADKDNNPNLYKQAISGVKFFITSRGEKAESDDEVANWWNANKDNPEVSEDICDLMNAFVKANQMTENQHFLVDGNKIRVVQDARVDYSGSAYSDGVDLMLKIKLKNEKGINFKGMDEYFCNVAEGLNINIINTVQRVTGLTGTPGIKEKEAFFKKKGFLINKFEGMYPKNRQEMVAPCSYVQEDPAHPERNGEYPSEYTNAVFLFNALVMSIRAQKEDLSKDAILAELEKVKNIVNEEAHNNPTNQHNTAIKELFDIMENAGFFDEKFIVNAQTYCVSILNSANKVNNVGDELQYHLDVLYDNILDGKGITAKKPKILRVHGSEGKVSGAYVDNATKKPDCNVVVLDCLSSRGRDFEGSPLMIGVDISTQEDLIQRRGRTNRNDRPGYLFEAYEIKPNQANARPHEDNADGKSFNFHIEGNSNADVVDDIAAEKSKSDIDKFDIHDYKALLYQKLSDKALILTGILQEVPGLTEEEKQQIQNGAFQAISDFNQKIRTYIDGLPKNPVNKYKENIKNCIDQNESKLYDNVFRHGIIKVKSNGNNPVGQIQDHKEKCLTEMKVRYEKLSKDKSHKLSNENAVQDKKQDLGYKKRIFNSIKATWKTTTQDGSLEKEKISVQNITNGNNATKIWMTELGSAVDCGFELHPIQVKGTSFDETQDNLVKNSLFIRRKSFFEKKNTNATYEAVSRKEQCYCIAQRKYLFEGQVQYQNIAYLPALDRDQIYFSDLNHFSEQNVVAMKPDDKIVIPTKTNVLIFKRSDLINERGIFQFPTPRTIQERSEEFKDFVAELPDYVSLEEAKSIYIKYFTECETTNAVKSEGYKIKPLDLLKSRIKKAIKKGTINVNENEKKEAQYYWGKMNIAKVISEVERIGFEQKDFFTINPATKQQFETSKQIKKQIIPEQIRTKSKELSIKDDDIKIDFEEQFGTNEDTLYLNKIIGKQAKNAVNVVTYSSNQKDFEGKSSIDDRYKEKMLAKQQEINDLASFHLNGNVSNAEDVKDIIKHHVEALKNAKQELLKDISNYSYETKQDMLQKIDSALSTENIKNNIMRLYKINGLCVKQNNLFIKGVAEFEDGDPEFSEQYDKDDPEMKNRINFENMENVSEDIERLKDVNNEDNNIDKKQDNLSEQEQQIVDNLRQRQQNIANNLQDFQNTAHDLIIAKREIDGNVEPLAENLNNDVNNHGLNPTSRDEIAKKLNDNLLGNSIPINNAMNKKNITSDHAELLKDYARKNYIDKAIEGLFNKQRALFNEFSLEGVNFDNLGTFQYNGDKYMFDDTAKSIIKQIEQSRRNIFGSKLPRLDGELDDKTEGDELEENKNLSDEEKTIKFVNEIKNIIKNSKFPPNNKPMTANYVNRFLDKFTKFLTANKQIAEKKRNDLIDKLSQDLVASGYADNEKEAQDILANNNINIGNVKDLTIQQIKQKIGENAKHLNNAQLEQISTENNKKHEKEIDKINQEARKVIKNNVGASPAVKVLLYTVGLPVTLIGLIVSDDFRRYATTSSEPDEPDEILKKTATIDAKDTRPPNAVIAEDVKAKGLKEINMSDPNYGLASTQKQQDQPQK